MSIKVMAEVWRDAPVAGTELLMLLALADMCDDDRECWPSVRHLMHKARLSEPQTRRVLRSLERAGLVNVLRNGGKGAKGRESNRYRIIELPLSATTPIADDTSTPIARDTSTPIADDTLNHHSEPSIRNTPLTPKGGKGRKRKTELPDHATWLANEYAPHRALAEALRTPFMSLDVPPENSTRASLMPYLEAARELSALGASAEDAAKLYSYVKKRAADEQWKVRFGVNALLKHYPEWRAQQQRKAKQATAAAQSAPPQVPILLLDYDAPEGNPPGAREVAS